MRKTAFAALAATLLLSGAAQTAGAMAATPGDAQSIVAAEAAFAKRAAEIGNVPAFREFAAPGVIMFLPEPIVATDYLAKASWPGLIEWRPDFVVVSDAADLAFASGPSQWTTKDGVDPGYYLTVWAKQPDGSWKFALDRGTPGAPNLYTAPPTAPEVHLLTGGEPSAATAAGLDAVLADGLSRDTAATLASRLDKSARVIRDGQAPAFGKEAALALLAKDPKAVQANHLGGAMSKSGDLAYSWGETRWTEDGKPRRGHYVRLWTRSGKTWSILMDHQVALPPPAPGKD